MFEAIKCLRVEFRPEGVITNFSYDPVDIPSEFTSWGQFTTFLSETRIMVELSSQRANIGRYSLTHYRPGLPAGMRDIIRDRSRLLR